MADVDTSWLTQLMPGQGANPLDTLMQMKDLQYRDAQIGSTQALEQYRQMQAQGEMMDLQGQQMFGQLVQQSVNPQTGEMDYDQLVSLVASNPMTARMFPELAEQLVNMNQTSYETIQTRLQNDRLSAETMARHFQELIPFGNGVTKDQIRGAYLDGGASLLEAGALDDATRDQLINELIKLEGMPEEQLGQYVQSNIYGALNAKDALDTVLNPSNPDARKYDAAYNALTLRGYPHDEAHRLATEHVADSITIETDANGQIRAWDNLTNQVINLPQPPRRGLGGDIAPEPNMSPGNIPMAPGMVYQNGQVVPAGTPASQDAAQAPVPSQGQFLPRYEQPIENESAGVVFGGVDSGEFYNIPQEEYQQLKDYVDRQPRIGEGLWADAGDATGLENWWSDFMARSVGQTGLEWATDTEDLDTIAKRQAFNMAQRAYTRAAALSDRYAVGEQNIIADETNFAPSWLDSPEALRARMIAISQNMKVRLANVMRDAVDPYLPDDVSAQAREEADNIARLLSLLNVPDGVVPADAAFENSQLFGPSIPRSGEREGEAQAPGSGQDSAYWAQRYRELGGNPADLDQDAQELLNGSR